MNIHEVKKATEALERANAALELARKNRASVSCSVQHQDRISVGINGAYIDLTEFDSSYCSRVIRGREMIALGAVKLMNEHVAQHEANVARKKAELEACVLDLARATLVKKAAA